MIKKSEMVNLSTLRTVVGFSFKGFGVSWSLADRFICDFLCDGNCGVTQESNCSFLFLFVGIIFVVCGYALVVMRDKQKLKLKKKLKKNFFSILKK